MGAHADRLPPVNLPEPPKIERRNGDGLDRRTRKRMEQKARRRRMHARNRAHNLRLRRQDHAEFYGVVNLLTGWQRNRWARSGYPGLKEKDADKVLPFKRLIHG